MTRGPKPPLTPTCLTCDHATQLHLPTRFHYFSKKLISFLFKYFSFTENYQILLDITMACSICTENFNASYHKPILCPVHSCAKTACRKCYQTFLCTDHITAPQCIFCNTHFTHSQLLHIGLTKLFLLGDFAKHQQNVLFAQEQAMLPAAQTAVAHDRLVSNIDAQIKDVSAQIKQLMALKLDLLQTKRQLQREGADTHSETTNDHFIHRCAHTDCNGFVSSAWKCATCEKYTCPHCREHKAAHDDPLHICNSDSVASVALLKSSTKPCPNCKVPVHKTDGCDQMFCTQCKRLWSWNTGKFETRGHNPHYLQWMRENHHNGMPRDPGDVLCGREIDPLFLSTLHRLIKATIASLPRDYDSHAFGSIFASFSSITHLRHHDLHQFQLVDRFHVNLHARKAFVSNLISLHKFKLLTRRNHLLLLKNEHILQIIQAVIQATTDIAFRFQHHLSLLPHAQTLALTLPLFHAQIQSFALELFNLKQYANHELLAIHKDFNTPPSKRLFISPHNFKLHTFSTFHYHISFQDSLQLNSFSSHPF